MNQANLKSRSLALTSIFVIILLIDLGWIYSRFPANWLHPTVIKSALELDRVLWIGVTTSPSIVNLLTLPVTISLLTLFIAMFITWRQKGIFIPGNKYALFLIPLILAILMFLWGSYCCIHPSPLFSEGEAKPFRHLDFIPLFYDYWIVKPWYAKVISDVFYTTMVGLFGFVCYIIRSKSWDGERWLAFWIIAHDVVFVCFICGMAESFTTRPFFW